MAKRAKKKSSKGKKKICYTYRCTKSGKPSKRGGYKKRMCRTVKKRRK